MAIDLEYSRVVFVHVRDLYFVKHLNYSVIFFIRLGLVEIMLIACLHKEQGSERWFYR